MLIFGIDPSITSTAVVCFDTGSSPDGFIRVTWYGRFKTKKGYVDALKRAGVVTDPTTLSSSFSETVDAVVAQQVDSTKKDTRFERYDENIAGVEMFIRRMISSSVRDLTDIDAPVYIAIENYAMRAMGNVYDIGEFGGLLRRMILGIPNCVMREHDPQSVKMFGSEGGGADKDQMRAAYDAMSGDPMFIPIDWITEKSSLTTDIVDAWFLAKLMQREVLLRKGLVKMSDFDDRGIMIFNRVTKAYPTNILARPFLTYSKVEL